MAVLCGPGSRISAQGIIDEQHIKVALRMIGHQVMLKSGDSTSRVLPIEKEAGYYRIRFAAEFGFVPEDLVMVVDSVVRETGIAKGYLVEDCGTSDVVYSYKMGDIAHSDVIPCKGRQQAKGCYTLLFTILEGNVIAVDEEKVSHKNLWGNIRQTGYIKVVLILAALLVLTGLWSFFRRKKTSLSNPDVIRMGEYLFDPRNMELSYKGESVELTSKESDLLLILYNSANETLERERILNTVWGDEGDYVGRTLDVFISKLRKKLEEDPGLKIVNIRGVGYKFIVNG
ncbi:MAG: winged helix-turn-helix domain-containing protein [Owenweeksia sp.]